MEKHLQKAFTAVLGKEPEKGTPERIAYNMAKRYFTPILGDAEKCKKGFNIDDTRQKSLELATSFGISNDFKDFPDDVKKELAAINARFTARYLDAFNF